MAIFNLGSINVDHVYRVPHLPAPGETLVSTEYATGLGGKGANQSVAAARAGSRVEHIGAIGKDGRWAAERIASYGVGIKHVVMTGQPTGHAIITVDEAGENAIVLYSGANQKQSLSRLKKALSDAGAGDVLMLQNETSLQKEAALVAREKGLFVVYSAAPFDALAAADVMPHIDLLVMNEIEADQLCDALGVSMQELSVPHLLITKGSDGAMWRDQVRGEVIEVGAFAVDVVDTTGAGDCFIGYTVAGMDQGLCAEEAMRLGAAASAIKVTRKGTADALPIRAEVDAFLAERGSK